MKMNIFGSLKPYKTFNFILLIFTFSLLNSVNSDSVCDLNTFLVEVKQDLADNGMLDCLRYIEPPHFVEETEEQKNLRIAAQWDTSCAFESSSNWMEQLKKNGISSLVDSVGEQVQKDFDDQADMCEILRAVIAQNLFDIPDLNMQKLPDEILDKIDCAGVTENPRSGPRICAVTGGSYFQKDSWTIFLNSASIKIGGKPNYNKSDDNKETVNNPYSNESNPLAQNQLIKDLMKFSKDQLDMKQGELANIIDKAEAKESNPNQQPEKANQNNSAKLTHVHSKIINNVTLPPAEEYALVDGGSSEFTVDENKIIFGYYMATVEIENKGDIFLKMRYADKEMSISRQSSSDATIATLTGAFAEVYQKPAESDGNINLEIYYRTSATAIANTDKGEQNFTFGAITFPEGSVYKHDNTADLEFSKSAKWNDIQNFSMTLKPSEERFYIIMYSLSFPLGGNYTFETRMKFGGKVIPETSVNNGPSKIVGIHAAIVVKSNKTNNNISVQYKYDGDQKVEIKDFTDNRFSQAITAFELPKSTEVHNFKVNSSKNLNTNGEWKSLYLDATIELKKVKTVLIIYNFNVNVDNKYFAARVRINQKFNKKSVFASKETKYACGQGYVPVVLQPGRYTIDIDYNSNSDNTFNPTSREEDLAGEVISMQIVLLD